MGQMATQLPRVSKSRQCREFDSKAGRNGLAWACRSAASEGQTTFSQAKAAQPIDNTHSVLRPATELVSRSAQLEAPAGRRGGPEHPPGRIRDHRSPSLAGRQEAHP
jgi:hypothetical protein